MMTIRCDEASAIAWYTIGNTGIHVLRLKLLYLVHDWLINKFSRKGIKINNLIDKAARIEVSCSDDRVIQYELYDLGYDNNICRNGWFNVHEDAIRQLAQDALSHKKKNNRKWKTWLKC